MRSLLFILAILLLCYGLWAHDWTTIIASVGVAVIWPAIENDVRNRQSEDQLWDALCDPRNAHGPGDWTQDQDGIWHLKDDDLSDSA